MVCFSYLNEGEWLGYTYYTPEAVLTFAKEDESLINIKVEVDSGAAITLLPHSVCDMLGLVWESGTPVSLGGVGGSRFTAYVHILNTYIGEQLVELPIAFAPTDDFPPLLGRLGLYQTANVSMDNDNASVCIGEMTSPIAVPSASPLGSLGVLAIMAVIGLVMFAGEK